MFERHPTATRHPAPAIVGLLLAWGGTALLVSPAADLVASPSSLSGAVFGQLVLWLLFSVIVGIVVFWEKQSLTSLWLAPLRWSSLAWASVLVLFTIVVTFPTTEWIRTAAGLPDYAIGMEIALAQPTWLRVFAVVTAGVVEETLFRGFAVTRLRRLGASVPLTVVVSSAVFAALHLPVWGTGPSLAFFVSGLVTTAFFAWRRDLWAMIIAYMAIDMWALVIAPAGSRWWD